MTQPQLKGQRHQCACCQERERIQGPGGDDDVVDQQHIEREDEAQRVDRRRIAGNAQDRPAHLLEDMADVAPERPAAGGVLFPVRPDQVDGSVEETTIDLASGAAGQIEARDLATCGLRQ